jgi:methylglyoxal synthase
MKYPLPARKRIALVAHDARKPDLLAWVKFHQEKLKNHQLFATGTTGSLIQAETGMPIVCFKSGPLGGDQQIGSKIAENLLDCLIFFWDPLEPQPHDPDVKALLRLAVLYNIPTASNLATADFLISSPWMVSTYDRILPDHLQQLSEIRQRSDD